jgi:malonyl-CoA O-methyltransferase
VGKRIEKSMVSIYLWPHALHRADYTSARLCMTGTARAIDAQALARAQARLGTARQAPWLHVEVAKRMAERLVLMKTQPQTVLDWWARGGGGHAALAKAYPHAAIQGVEISAVASRATTAPAPWWRRIARKELPVLHEQAVAERGAQLVWANMVLHHSADPGALMAQWRRGLAVDGFLMLSTLGPDTLAKLRGIYRDAGWGSPHAPFVDMHDIGDMLVQAGFNGPVMDQEQLTLTWATPDAALAELHTLGINADSARHAGLRTPRWRQRLCDALREHAADKDGRIALGFEIVYGHAFNPPPRFKVAGQTEVSLDEMRTLVKNTPTPRRA